MKRRTVVILSLFSALLSLIYVLFGYFGINRYLSLHMFSTESYRKNYSKLDQASEKERVVIVMTTTPDRHNKIKPTINSLLDQTVRVNEIAMNIPYGENKTLEQYKNVILTYNHSLPYGEVAKLISTLFREGEETTKIILVNDDMVYGKDFIEEMIEESNKHPDKVITAKDLNSKHGILVKPKFFNQTVIDYDGKSTHTQWLKKHLKVPHKSINYKQSFKSIF